MEALLEQIRLTEKLVGHRITVEIRSNGAGRFYTNGDRGETFAVFSDLQNALVMLQNTRRAARNRILSDVNRID